MLNSAHAKAIVALVMAALVVLDQLLGISVGWLTEQWLTMLFAVLSPILVYFIPNKPRT